MPEAVVGLPVVAASADASIDVSELVSNAFDKLARPIKNAVGYASARFDGVKKIVIDYALYVFNNMVEFNVRLREDASVASGLNEYDEKAAEYEIMIDFAASCCLARIHYALKQGMAHQSEAISSLCENTGARVKNYRSNISNRIEKYKERKAREEKKRLAEVPIQPRPDEEWYTIIHSNGEEEVVSESQLTDERLEAMLAEKYVDPETGIEMPAIDSETEREINMILYMRDYNRRRNQPMVLRWYDYAAVAAAAALMIGVPLYMVLNRHNNSHEENVRRVYPIAIKHEEKKTAAVRKFVKITGISPLSGTEPVEGKEKSEEMILAADYKTK